jgi:hypothetical protein
MERAIGIIEGMAACTEQNYADMLMGAVEMLETGMEGLQRMIRRSDRCIQIDRVDGN